jgi:hypothetical protein
MKGVRAPMLAAVMVFLVPPGAAVAMDAHHASPLHRPAMIVTDAHHAALVVHAGRRPLVISQTFFAGPALAAPSSHSTRFRAWLDPAVVCIALLGLIVGALLICRARILQTRSVNALWDEMVTVDEHKLVDADQPDPVSFTRTSSCRHPHQPQPELSPQSRQV